MLCWPFRSPFRASRRLPGGALRNSSVSAASSCDSLRSDTQAKALNLRGVLPSYSASVSLHLNDRITRRLYYALRNMASDLQVRRRPSARGRQRRLDRVACAGPAPVPNCPRLQPAAAAASAGSATSPCANRPLPGIAPSNAYRCRDGYVLVAGNSDSIFRRLMAEIGRPELAAVSFAAAIGSVCISPVGRFLPANLANRLP